MGFPDDEIRSLQHTSEASRVTVWLGHLDSLASRALALIALAVFFPALLGLGVLIAVTSQGPILVEKAYLCVRSGRIVYLYEFRTECRLTWQETQCGAFLRRTGLHGLPRLLNVLLGQIGSGERLQRLSG